MLKINDKISFKYFVDKLNEIFKIVKDDTYSTIESNEELFPEDSHNEFDFWYLNPNLQNETGIFSEIPGDILPDYVSPENKKFLSIFQRVLEINIEKCNALINLNKIPDLEELDDMDNGDLNFQMEFLKQIYEEYGKISILNENMKIRNVQLFQVLTRTIFP